MYGWGPEDLYVGNLCLGSHKIDFALVPIKRAHLLGEKFVFDWGRGPRDSSFPQLDQAFEIEGNTLEKEFLAEVMAAGNLDDIVAESHR